MAIGFREGELARVDRGGHPITSSDPHEKMRWLAMLIAIQQERNRKPGWVHHSYVAKFGDAAPSYHIDPLPPSLEVRAWVRHRDIAWAKAQEKQKQGRAA